MRSVSGDVWRESGVDDVHISDIVMGEGWRCEHVPPSFPRHFEGFAVSGLSERVFGGGEREPVREVREGGRR